MREWEGDSLYPDLNTFKSEWIFESKVLVYHVIEAEKLSMEERTNAELSLHFWDV